MRLTEEELTAKAIQLIQSGLWKSFVEVVLDDEVKKLDDAWGNKEIEDIKEMQIKKRLLKWLKEMPHRIVQESNKK